jgi:hypothetical protein
MAVWASSKSPSRPTLNPVRDGTRPLHDDVMLRWARRLLLAGLLGSSLLSLRVGGFTIGDILLLASLGCTIGSARRPRVPPLGYTVIAWLIATGGCLASWRSSDAIASLLIASRLLYVVALLPWHLRVLLHGRQRLTTATSWWVTGAAISGLGAILQFQGGAAIIPGGVVTSGRYGGFTQHVSDAGGVTSVGFAFCMAALLATQITVRRRVLLVACLILTGTGMILSGSVSAVLSVMVAGVVLCLRGSVSLRRALFIGLAVVAMYVIAGYVQSGTQNALSLGQRIHQVTQVDGRYNTSASRLETDRRGLQGIRSNP